MVASGWRPISRQLRRIRYRPGHFPGDFVDVRVNRGPQNVVEPDHLSFLTQSRKDVIFSTGYRPSRIVFRNLGGIQVRDIDLPATVPCRRGEIRVVRFTSTGFVVTEDDTVGDRVEVDIYN